MLCPGPQTLLWHFCIIQTGHTKHSLQLVCWCLHTNLHHTASTQILHIVIKCREVFANPVNARKLPGYNQQANNTCVSSRTKLYFLISFYLVYYSITWQHPRKPFTAEATTNKQTNGTCVFNQDRAIFHLFCCSITWKHQRSPWLAALSSLWPWCGAPAHAHWQAHPCLQPAAPPASACCTAPPAPVATSKLGQAMYSIHSSTWEHVYQSMQLLHPKWMHPEWKCSSIHA